MHNIILGICCSCKDLTGLVLTSVVNIFLKSPAVEYALLVIGVIIFTRLIAYDAQKLKHIYYSGYDASGKVRRMGAFTLYLDFINLFVFLMRFLGVKKMTELSRFSKNVDSIVSDTSEISEQSQIIYSQTLYLYHFFI